MNKIFCLVLLVFIAQTSSCAQTTYRDNRVDSIFEPWNKPGSPGCALGVIRNGRLLYQQDYGMADLENDRPITPATLFNIASLSKQFTAAGILLLQQRGKLSLDDKVRKYIPELPDYTRLITIRQLLDHTSGIRDYIQMMFLAGAKYSSIVSSKDALNMVNRQKALNFNPGEEWQYSNSGYVLASIIVERVSGKTFSDFERENIFLPLGMKNTGFDDENKSSVFQNAVGYEPDPGKGFRPLITNWRATGDGGMHSTIEDLVLWDQNFYKPKVGGQDMIRQLLTPNSLNDGTVLSYSLGLGIATYKGLKIISHEGEWAGYRAEYLRFPEQNFSVIVLCNLSAMVPASLARQVAELYLGEKMTNIQTGASLAASLNTIPADSTELSRFTGFFRNPDDELIRQIIIRNKKLVYVRSQNNVSELAPAGENKFRMMGIPTETTLVFTTSESKVAGFSLVTPNTKPIHFDSFTPVALSPEHLPDYCGTYHSDELNID